MEYHPHDIPHIIVCKIYEKNCTELSNFKYNSGEELGINKLLIAYSQPKNLWDILLPTTQHQADGKSVIDIMGEAG